MFQRFCHIDLADSIALNKKYPHNIYASNFEELAPTSKKLRGQIALYLSVHMKSCKLASVVQLDGHPTGDQEVVGLTPSGSAKFSWELIMKYFLQSFSPFR